VARSDAPALAHDLGGRGLPFVIASMVAGVVALGLIVARRYAGARAAAATAVTAVLFAWGAGRYPLLLPGLSAGDAQALPATVRATAWVVAIGAALLLPSMVLLFVLFQRTHHPAAAPTSPAANPPEFRRS